jgi:HEPN domain-containing protein
MAGYYTIEPLNAVEKEWLLKWMRKADSDLRAAATLAPEPEDYDAVGFHCQQAVEKYLKARLYVAFKEPSRTHDLLRLLAELDGEESFSAEEVAMARLLNPFAVKFRYPTDDAPDDPPMTDLLAAARHFRDRLVPAIEAALR